MKLAGTCTHFAKVKMHLYARLSYPEFGFTSMWFIKRLMMK